MFLVLRPWAPKDLWKRRDEKTGSASRDEVQLSLSWLPPGPRGGGGQRGRALRLCPYPCMRGLRQLARCVLRCW